MRSPWAIPNDPRITRGTHDLRGEDGWDSCSQCGKRMNPVERMLGEVCGDCCRANEREVTNAH